MKKLCLFLAIVTLLLSIVSCGGSSETSKEESKAEASTEEKSEAVSIENVEKGYIFVYNGVKVCIGAEAECVISAIGTPQNEYTSDSCAFAGQDTVYYYSGFEISANNETGKFIIYSVYLKDDTVTTSEGAYIGMSADEVKAVYGEPASISENSIGYVKEGTVLEFYIEDGKVSSVFYNNYDSADK